MSKLTRLLLPASIFITGLIGWTVFNNTVLNTTTLEMFSPAEVVQSETRLDVTGFRVVHIARTTKSAEVEGVPLLWPMIGELFSVSKDSDGILQGELHVTRGNIEIFCAEKTVTVYYRTRDDPSRYNYSDVPDLKRRCQRGRSIFSRYIQ